MTERALKSKKIKLANSSILLKRQGLASEVAKGACFLASQDSSYMTGQVLNVNGGLYFLKNDFKCVKKSNYF